MTGDHGKPRSTQGNSAGGVVSDLLVGVSLGVFIGILVGLSTSPVVAALVGVVSAGAMAALGLAERSPGTPVMGARVIGFGFAAAIAAPAGIWMRTHEVLAPTPSEYIERWEGIELSDEQKTALAMSRFAGLVPSGVVDEAGEGPGTGGQAGLFAVTTTDLAQTDPQGSSELGVLLQKWENRKEPFRGVAIAVRAGDFDDEQARAILQRVWSDLNAEYGAER